MRVLIGGEYSGTIRDAFSARGHDAMSCDLSPASGNHYQGDWFDVIEDGWDLGIFHPTCTNMANSGAKHIYQNGSKVNGLNEERWLKIGQDAWKFWNLIQVAQCYIQKVAIENPIMNGYARLMVGEPTQVIQPWWFAGSDDDESNEKKATCLWLFGLPRLVAKMPLFESCVDGSTARDSIHMAAPTKDPEERKMKRSKTFPGIAEAMADQWG
jgi:hypothetical protein